MIENMVSIFSSIGSHLCSLISTYDSNTPTPAPPITIQTNEAAA